MNATHIPIGIPLWIGDRRACGGIASSTSAWCYTRRILAALIGAAALLLPPAAWAQRTTAAYPDTESLLHWRARSGFDSLRTQMAGRAMRIPRVHGLTLGYGTIALPSDQATVVQFPLHLPDLRPFSAETVKQRGAGGWSKGDTLFLVLEHHHQTTRQLKTVEDQHRLKIDRTPDHSDPPMLRRYVQQPTEEWFYNVLGDGTVGFIAYCTIESPNNYCKGLFRATPHIAVNYTFSKTYLANWRDIDRDVRALVQSLFE